MRQTYIRALVAVVLMALPLSAWSAVSISWDDLNGNHVVPLQLISNPDNPPEWWINKLWYGELEITTDSLSPIVFTGTGNFSELSNIYPYVKLKQTVGNQTTSSWVDFHIVLDGGYFYKKWLLQNGWDADQSDYAFDFYVNGGSPIAPGESFADGVIFMTEPDAEGEGTFTLTKWPTVPEVGSAAVLLAGLGGMLTYIRRRRS